MHYSIRAFKPIIFHIVHDLSALGVTRKVQVMGSLQVDKLFITGL